ncbi:MAG: flagellar protein FlgN [Steroidobacteraceae bacterium]|jgi:flagellar biosynthesis/type III secretory pathway chaperone|nr:flagellar protein FlgN [Steroidobacteraceae bacterium]
MNPAALNDLASVLERQAASARRLLAALDAERTALAGEGSAPEALEAATADKQRCLADFEQLEQARVRVLSGAGFGPARDDMAAFLRAAEDPNYSHESPRPGPVATRWRQLLELVVRLRDANERNGMIVGIRSRQVRQLLNVLRTGRPDELTYGPVGAGRAIQSRELGRV